MRTALALVALAASACALLAPPKVLAFEYDGKAELFVLEEVDTERAVRVHPTCMVLVDTRHTCQVAIPEGWGGRRVFLRSYASGFWSSPGTSITLPRVR